MGRITAPETWRAREARARVADSGPRDCLDEHALYSVVLALLVLLLLHDPQSHYSLFGFALLFVESLVLGAMNPHLYKSTPSYSASSMITAMCYDYDYALLLRLWLWFMKRSCVILSSLSTSIIGKLVNFIIFVRVILELARVKVSLFNSGSVDTLASRSYGIVIPDIPECK